MSAIVDPSSGEPVSKYPLWVNFRIFCVFGIVSAFHHIATTDPFRANGRRRIIDDLVGRGNNLVDQFEAESPLARYLWEVVMPDTANKPKSANTAVKETAKAVEQHSRTIVDSAKQLKSSSAHIEDSAERTTRLAADRTILAAERTYAAWVRTGLFALASGLGARALLTGVLSEWLVIADASMLIAFSVFCFGAAIWRHLNPGPPPPVPDVKRIPHYVLITVNGFLALVSLAALIAIWFTPLD